MRIFKGKKFGRFARKEKISDAALSQAIKRAASGSIDADLGGGLIKQRIARAGAGRAGGFRTVIAFRRGQIAVFLHGFAKNKQDNLDVDELDALKKAARVLFGLSDAEVNQAVTDDQMSEIENEV